MRAFRTLSRPPGAPEALVALLLLSACGSGEGGAVTTPPPPPPVVTQSVAVAPATLSLVGVGTTGTLTATVTTSAGVATTPAVAWSSSNSAVATVSGTGSSATVTSVAPGTATITATSGGQSGSTAVSVSLPPQTLSVTMAGAGSGTVTSTPAGIRCTAGTCTAAFAAGTSVALTIAPEAGSTLEAWSGDCTGTGACTIVMAQARSVTATLRRLPAPVASVTITPGVVDLDEGAATTLTATARDAAGNVLTGRTVVWRTSDSTRATVSPTGVVTGRSEGDTVRISATVDSVQATARIVVRSLVFLATDVSVGSRTTCAVRVSGGTWCFGDGPLGSTTARPGGPRNLVDGSASFTQVALGDTHACALDRQGRVFCWGTNGDGELGNGTFGTGTFVPGPVAGGLTFASLHGGYFQTCAITGAGRTFCWGSNRFGQLAVGTTGVFVTQPTQLSGNDMWAVVDPGYLHSCGLTTGGAARCWGDQTGVAPENRGALGDGANAARLAPTPVSGTRQWRSIAVGNAHSCAIDTDGVAWCWGRNREGQLGTGNTTSTSVPTAVLTTLRFTSITAGVIHTCAIATDEEAYCWGANSDGQLGIGSTTTASSPTRVGSGSVRFRRVVGGATHSCGIAIDRTLYCWGSNNSGQAGNTTPGILTRPTVVARP